jgi:hypothetical protein
MRLGNNSLLGPGVLAVAESPGPMGLKDLRLDTNPNLERSAFAVAAGLCHAPRRVKVALDGKSQRSACEEYTK